VFEDLFSWPIHLDLAMLKPNEPRAVFCCKRSLARGDILPAQDTDLVVMDKCRADVGPTGCEMVREAMHGFA
jgi:hypothetical protein